MKESDILGIVGEANDLPSDHLTHSRECDFSDLPPILT